VNDQIGYSRAIPLPDSMAGQSRGESNAGGDQESLTPFLSEPPRGDTGSSIDETGSADDSRWTRMTIRLNLSPLDGER